MQIELFCSKELPWLLQIKEKKLQYLAEKKKTSQVSFLSRLTLCLSSLVT